MCTTLSKKIGESWILAKTRDPVEWMRWDDEIKLFDGEEDSCKKLIIQNPDPNEDGYYGGINEYGVAYISTFVKVAENQISYIRRPYVRLILEAKSAKEAVEIIKSFNPRIGGNMFVADAKECFGFEGVPEVYFVEQIKPEGAVKTNHFFHVRSQDLDYKKDEFSKEWTQTHFTRATELLADVQSVEDMIGILKDRKNSNKKMAICTTSKEEECFTHSAFVFDTKEKCVWYAQGNPLEVEFKRFGF